MTCSWEDLENEEYMYRIMIVEDDEVIANAIRQHLVSWGMEAFCVQDFYDVWLFHRDIKIEEMRLQETEVVDVQWVNPDKLFEMFRLKHLHPLITYVDQLIG